MIKKSNEYFKNTKFLKYSLIFIIGILLLFLLLKDDFDLLEIVLMLMVSIKCLTDIFANKKYTNKEYRKRLFLTLLISIIIAILFLSLDSFNSISMTSSLEFLPSLIIIFFFINISLDFCFKSSDIKEKLKEYFKKRFGIVVLIGLLISIVYCVSNSIYDLNYYNQYLPIFSEEIKLCEGHESIIYNGKEITCKYLNENGEKLLNNIKVEYKKHVADEFLLNIILISGISLFLVSITEKILNSYLKNKNILKYVLSATLTIAVLLIERIFFLEITEYLIVILIILKFIIDIFTKKKYLDKDFKKYLLILLVSFVIILLTSCFISGLYLTVRELIEYIIYSLLISFSSTSLIFYGYKKYKKIK